MFGRLVQKELTQYLMDFRFIAVFGLCVLLSALSVYVGVENYAQQMREYQATSQTHRQDLQAGLDNRDTPHRGYRWGRRPEPLSPLVFGLSGKLGREVYIQHELMPRMEASLFEVDPVYALFGVLDLAFIVKFVLSLAVLLEAVLKLSVSPESEQKIRQIGWIYRRYGAFWLVLGGCFYNFSKAVRIFKTAS